MGRENVGGNGGERLVIVGEYLLTDTRGGEERVDVVAELEGRERGVRRMNMGKVELND